MFVLGDELEASPIGPIMKTPKSEPNRGMMNQVRGGWRVFAIGTKPALGPIVILAALAMATPPAFSKAGSLAGSWSGGGWVSFASGTKERARCRARYSRAGGDSYVLSATCATASGKASQTATVYEVSPNRYRGSFHNTEYNVSGSIRVVVHGNSQSVTLSGDSGSASLKLSRR
ncbi:MAG: hypothetical protein K8F92_17045 [Hyphomicrobium sp.]|uniref:hypothetical protein n=1 Tax=Hyphomicrobium sp. TaxID=82 RepID=UPI001326DCE3|nr:hypothetical protein [Hyphomicrobium sp.]KAB2940766.1 MAG: hypothetical protein F9K20_11725 [Hyphomicrobium sp.]MBZ0211334.1 hypothetical protein [Hyphomicrobium sp.]MCZ7595410.1 hypothetical protein [Hyphomicrobium sp.]